MEKSESNQSDAGNDYKDENPEISYGAFGCIILAIFWITMAAVFIALKK